MYSNAVKTEETCRNEANQFQCHCSSNRKLYFKKHSTHIMLKESVAAVLFIFGVAAPTPIPIDKDEIVQAHNFVRRRVSPSAANMQVMVSYH